MDTYDRLDSNVPARYPGDSPRVPAPFAAMSHDLAVAPPPSGPQITPRILMRGISRHWRRIMVLWLVASTPLIYVIHRMVEPTYTATSVLRAEPTQPELYATLRSAMDNNSSYLGTQVQVIRSNTVLDAALAKPGISNLPMILSSKDPRTDLRTQMKVGIVVNTYLIEVALTSRNPDEAAAIVNAVVEAYMDQHTRYHQTKNQSLRTNLTNELAKLNAKLDQKQKELGELVERGNIPVDERLKPKSNSKEEDDGAPGSSFDKVTESMYHQTAGELFKIEADLIDMQATLDTVRDRLARAQEAAAAGGDQRAQLEDEQFQDRIRDEFMKEPEVRPLIEKINETKARLERGKALARRSDDPAVQASLRQHKQLVDRWEELWGRKKGEIAERLRAGGEDQGPAEWEKKAKGLEGTIELLNKKRFEFAKRLAGLKVVSQTKNSELLRASILREDLGYLRRLQDSVNLKLAQLEFEIGQEAYRITVQDDAKTPTVASSNKRIRYMAVVPLGILFLMLGLFLLVEIKAERVGDPDALSTRVNSEVYALPPLPTRGSIRKRSPEGADDQIEQFIQRLDHLRFAVCGSPADLEKGRCVLITSAIGGEGKTTLAVQLAARCGNAGMSTLLIDADLRRTELCKLLEVEEGPGLSDALMGDDPAPTELVVPVQGGTFHLLPAGTPQSDTSRVLQNRKLGLLIAQFRQIYDLVIVDSPPVLPVPDALILGRWVDGAVLAVRYDISRFPQVERARRQLDGAGIAVLGTVINGMKNSDSYYGRYSYSRRRSPQADSPAAL